jgi:hypothetical protein
MRARLARDPRSGAIIADSRLRFRRLRDDHGGFTAAPGETESETVIHLRGIAPTKRIKRQSTIGLHRIKLMAANRVG